MSFRIVHSVNSSGEDLANMKNSKHCFVMRQSENNKYGYFGTNIKR